MKEPLLYDLKKKARQLSWPLLIFLILVLNVKLVVKVAAVLLVCLYNWREFSVKKFLSQQYLWFYLGLVGIGIINLLLQYRTLTNNYLLTAFMGLSFWLMSAVIAYNLHMMIQKEESRKIYNTLTVFFVIHIALIFFNLLQIMIETGSINPYTYKGMNQKYYISTGDFITGINFDAPVTTAFVCAFSLLYFLYRRQFLLSVAAMASLLVMASNFANLILLGVFAFAFVFWSDRIQKSLMLVYMVMLVIFMARISPQNNEHVGRIFYQVINKPYDLPPEKVIPLEQLKKEPDSVLSFEDRRKKYAQNFIDSVNGIRLGPDYKEPQNILEAQAAVISKPKIDSSFYRFQESSIVEEKINQYTNFLNQMYDSAIKDSLLKLYNWKSTGKWIAVKQLADFFKQHPKKLLTGTGIGNFSSRLAFKATLLNIAGRYPAQWKYVSPDFFNNHLFLYLYYHSKNQSEHEASNTPDAVYFQVAGEYGIIGILILLLFYFGYFARHINKKSFGLPLLFLLAGAFFAEYWFEQFSIVILFELLFFSDIKDMRREEQEI